MREQLRSLIAAANAPLAKRVSALELAYQEQRAQLVTYRHADAATLERVTAQRDGLQGLLASAMGERDAWEARAGEVWAERDAAEAEANASEYSAIWQEIAKELRETVTIDGARDEIRRLKQRDRDADTYGDALVDLTGIANPEAAIGEIRFWRERISTAEAQADAVARHRDELSARIRQLDCKEGCDAKPGSPVLCQACLLRRFDAGASPEWAESRLARLLQKRDTLKGEVAELTADLECAEAAAHEAIVARNAAEARAHDLANEVMALREIEADHEPASPPLPVVARHKGRFHRLEPMQAKWVGVGGPLWGECDLVSSDVPFATVRISEHGGWCWRVMTDADDCAVVTGVDGERFIAKEQALEVVREHWGPVEVVA